MTMVNGGSCGQILSQGKNATAAGRLSLWILALAITTLCLSPRVAHAQPPGHQAPASPPNFVTLDRVGPGSTLGIDYGIGGDFDSASFSVAQRIELHGRYWLANAVGVYGALPVHSTHGDGDDRITLPGSEFGLLYVPFQSVYLRAGLSLSFASDNPTDYAANLRASSHRLTDVAQSVPETTMARFGISYRGRLSRLVYQLDLGVELPLNDTSYTLELLNHANIGIGYRARSFTVTSELVTVFWLGHDSGDDISHSAGASITLHQRFAPYLGLYTTIGSPLDGDGRLVLLRGGLNLAL